jgi:hypothetical protein
MTSSVKAASKSVFTSDFACANASAVARTHPQREAVREPSAWPPCLCPSRSPSRPCRLYLLVPSHRRWPREPSPEWEGQ